MAFLIDEPLTKTAMNENLDRDYILVECNLEKLKTFTAQLEQEHPVTLIREPSVCLTLIRAEDSIEQQEFYLGEALTSECEVGYEGQIGYGVCLGEEPERAYCLAVIDAIIHAHEGIPSAITEFLENSYKEINHKEEVEFNQILKTRVDFKMFSDE